MARSEGEPKNGRKKIKNKDSRESGCSRYDRDTNDAPDRAFFSACHYLTARTMLCQTSLNYGVTAKRCRTQIHAFLPFLFFFLLSKAYELSFYFGVYLAAFRRRLNHYSMSRTDRLYVVMKRNCIFDYVFYIILFYYFIFYYLTINALL